MILIVEDEPELNRMICDYLASKGFEAVGVHDGPAALRAVFERHPDLVVLDLNLPGLGGLDVARAIRSETSIPVLMATARGDESERLAGFEAGADDYVVKPFSLPELALRVAAILRRTATRADEHESEVHAGALILDRERRTVHVDGRRVQLTTAQFDILLKLAMSPGRVFSRLQLLEAISDDAWEGYERTIDVHIKNIRKVIEHDPRHPTLIVTVRGVGYRLEEHS